MEKINAKKEIESSPCLRVFGRDTGTRAHTPEYSCPYAWAYSYGKKKYFLN